MPLLAITRLRLRSIRFLPQFAWLAVKSFRQASQAEGCRWARTRHTDWLVFWTATLWRDEAAMRAYVGSGIHKTAMPKLKNWCDEAAVAHAEVDDADIKWPDIEDLLMEEGRLSLVKHPSPSHSAGILLGSSAPSF